MSVSKWAYEPEKCDGQPCPGDCDNCSLEAEGIDTEEIEKLIQRRDRLDMRIRELRSGSGHFKISYDRRPSQYEGYGAREKIKPYDRYCLQVKYEPIKGKPRWEPVYAAETKAEVIAEIPKIIRELKRALKLWRAQMVERQEPVMWTPDEPFIQEIMAEDKPKEGDGQ